MGCGMYALRQPPPCPEGCSYILSIHSFLWLTPPERVGLLFLPSLTATPPPWWRFPLMPRWSRNPLRRGDDPENLALVEQVEFLAVQLDRVPSELR